MKEKRTQDHLIFKVSLLSISIFLMMAPAISPALPLMYHAFPGINQAGVETLATIPNIGIVIGLLISPFLIKIIGEKATILSGLILTLLAGTFPMYATAYTPILVSRFLIGAGIGLFNSLAVSLIPQFYGDDEEKLATMVGFQNVMGGLGAAVASFLISYLITISWHAAFAIYFLVIPAFILFTIFVPLPHAVKSNSKHNKDRQTINGKVILISVLMFLIFLFYMPVSFKLPALVVEEKLGNVSELSILTGILNLVSIPVGASFGFFFKKLHDKVFPIGFMIVAISFAIITFAPNFAILASGNLLLGIGFGLAVPYMYNWLDWSAPQNSVNLATTIVLVLVNVGCAVSPMILNAVTSNAKSVMLISTTFFVLFTIYAFAHYFRVHSVSSKKALE
ncbi:MFS transporter [Lactobacillus kalixensis]|uniref:Major facilitator superfamily transporter permease n=1 Tax=Lactobacillus kalixensis DSM 16043 TaxID=1423763 RepID=A0A0R1U785_9LACO|nr:MFS transporter [Lactobacillus kalixensis]KRL89063.1 major facilitator superfamily transporter permease [Lactobacillus kalixensis DSM 16043]